MTKTQKEYIKKDSIPLSKEERIANVKRGYDPANDYNSGEFDEQLSNSEGTIVTITDIKDAGFTIDKYDNENHRVVSVTFDKPIKISQIKLFQGQKIKFEHTIYTIVAVEVYAVGEDREYDISTFLLKRIDTNDLDKCD